jgi:hypothetical protein
MKNKLKLSIAPLILLFFLFQLNLGIRWNFFKNLDERLSFIEQHLNLDSEKIKVSSQISDGGEVHLERNNESSYIKFFYYRGITDNFSAFYYVKSLDDLEPIYKDCSQVEKEIDFTENWVWLACS